MIPKRIENAAYGMLKEFDLVSTQVRLFSLMPNCRTGVFPGHKSMISVIMFGDCLKTSGYETGQLKSGSVAAMRQSSTPTEIIGRERGITWFHFELDEETEHLIAKITGRFHSVYRSSNPTLTCAAIRLLHLIEFPYDDSQWDCEGIIDNLINLLINDARIDCVNPNVATKVHDLICDNFEQPIDLRFVAKEVQCNPSHLGRSFKKTYGCTPGEFMRQVRFCKSLNLLAAGATVLECAHACGFADESHFCRVFKNLSGFSPTKWRSIGRA